MLVGMGQHPARREQLLLCLPSAATLQLLVLSLCRHGIGGGVHHGFCVLIYVMCSELVCLCLFCVELSYFPLLFMFLTLIFNLVNLCYLFYVCHVSFHEKKV